ncbi:hypothetical protein NMG60_11017219 [Bertholletia excelsa]
MGRSGALLSDLVPNTRGVGFAAPTDRGRVFVARVPVDVESGRGTGFDSQLPADAMPRPTHIFRPFVGYKEVRLVSKESKHRDGDPLILCFVDFINPTCAATALNALQGYKMDEHDPGSPYLRLQFSKHPGPRSGSGFRGRR